ncbi:type I restriction enzyme M protein [Candidatus Methanomarinus sp.]|nr:type I restriction enzyme M protein [ANME-2 cluster archaeon]
MPEGYKKYNKTKPLRIEEFDLEKAWWEDREENQYAWGVSIDEIKKRNYNLDIKNPYRKDADVELGKNELIEKIGMNLQKANELLRKIKREF